MNALDLLWILPCLVLGMALFWLGPLKLLWRLVHHFGLSTPCPAALARLVDNPFRRRYMNVVLDRTGIREGERVLELGPGPGAFTVDAARRLGPSGQLVAVDIQPKMIDLVRQREREAGLANVQAYVSSAYDLPLDDESVDRAFLVTVLPEIPDQMRALRELRRVLKPAGVLSITEEFSDPDYVFACETIRRAEASGFRLVERSGSLWVYTANFRRSEPVAGRASVTV